MSEDVLFCVHIAGMDDVIPVHSMGEAIKVAAYLNAEYAELHQRMTAEGKKYLPYCFSAPAIWPHSAEDHAKWLEELKDRAKEQACPHWMCT
ncbi:hypothetical protein [Halomonas sp. 328]|uniref:hypothetical protein n=1 Tax=Halomonas sp. 328 TaxID=2776704 RepID=UPI0018A6DE91|nr:hypothetical protein [Halomonas sp. 328]MBF8221031.1 hypothetical protein [Halomonas sp. 328]